MHYARYLKPMKNVVIMKPPTWCFLRKLTSSNKSANSASKAFASPAWQSFWICFTYAACNLQNNHLLKNLWTQLLTSGNNVPYCHQMLHLQCDNACRSIPKSTVITFLNKSVSFKYCLQLGHSTNWTLAYPMWEIHSFNLMSWAFVSTLSTRHVRGCQWLLSWLSKSIMNQILVASSQEDTSIFLLKLSSMN